MNTFTISGYYGNGNESDIFVYDNGTSYWYAVEGSHNVNCTIDPNVEEDGCNIEMLVDFDSFTTRDPIESEEDLINAVEG